MNLDWLKTPMTENLSPFQTCCGQILILTQSPEGYSHYADPILGHLLTLRPVSTLEGTLWEGHLILGDTLERFSDRCATPQEAARNLEEKVKPVLAAQASILAWSSKE